MTDPTHTPKQPADALLGRPSPAPARFSRRAVLLFVMLTSLGFAAALMWGLLVDHTPKRVDEDAEREVTIRPVQPDFTTALPSDYSQYRPAPPVPPPAPAEPVQTRPSPEPSTPVPATPAPAPVRARDPSSAPDLPTPTRASTPRGPTPEEIERERAAGSGIFFAGTQDAGAAKVEAASVTPPGATGAADPADAAGGNAGRKPGAYAEASADQGMQGQKSDFIAAATLDADYVAAPLADPISPYEVKAGTVIPAALLTAVNSDLPGDVIATVTENVYDTATGRHLLIPQGARLYGRYDSLISYGQDRALLVWQRIILPNGTSINIGSMIGASGDGTAGLRDSVDRHIPELAGAIFLSTALAVTTSLAESLDDSNSDTTVITDGSTEAADQTQRVGERVVDKELNRPNTIKIRAGWTLRVLVNKDMVLRPYAQ